MSAGTDRSKTGNGRASHAATPPALPPSSSNSPYREIDVALPKWEMEYGARLLPPLAAMGMEVAFDPLEADFSRLSPVPIFVSDVQHKTFLKVDEEGSEAAAATSVEGKVLLGDPGLVVNRPFLVAIRERLSGTILFIGIVRDPR